MTKEQIALRKIKTLSKSLSKLEATLLTNLELLSDVYDNTEDTKLYFRVGNVKDNLRLLLRSIRRCAQEMEHVNAEK